MSAWPNRYERCKNCGCDADHRPYGSRGYCSRCFYLIRRIENVKAWDRTRPETLRGIDKLVAAGLDDDFEFVRKDFVRQAKARLSCLRVRQMRRNGELEVEGLDIEHKLGKLLRFLRPKAAYPQNASDINHHFNSDERRILYGLLDDLEEHLPWKGFSLDIRKARGKP
jgi:hypothetical protein